MATGFSLSLRRLYIRIRGTLSDESQQPEVPESELIRVRREKLKRIAALGYNPYPTTADVDTTIA